MNHAEDNNERLELTTLVTVTDGNLAEILKLALADEEIDCVIEGEHQAGLTGVFKIRVLVSKKDLPQAEEVLHRHAGDAAEKAEEEEEREE